MHTPTVRRQLERKLGPSEDAGRAEYRFKDEGYHYCVNLSKEVWIEYKSGRGGHLRTLLSDLGIEHADEPERAPTVQELRKRMRSLGKQERPQKQDAGLPDFYLPLRTDSRVHRYLERRGVTDEDVEVYGIGEGRYPYDNRAVIPSYGPDGTCEYWVTRRIYDEPKWKRYQNAPVPRTHHVGFLEIAKEYGGGHVILTEGVFSALAVGRSGICSYGERVTDRQLRKIARAGIGRVTVALDGDAFEMSMDVGARLVRLGLPADVVPLPLEQDPADLGREAFHELVEEESIPLRTETDILLARTRRLVV